MKRVSLPFEIKREQEEKKENQKLKVYVSQVHFVAHGGAVQGRL